MLGSTYAVYQVSRGLFQITVNNILMRSGGELLVAEYSVISTVYQICLSAGMGIAATGLLMSGVFYGQGDRDGLDDLLRMLIRNVLIINFVLVFVIILFADPVINLFSRDPTIKAACVFGIRIMIIGIIPFSFGATMKSFYQGIHRIMISQTICILQNFAFGILMLLLTVSLLHSAAAPWIGITVGETLIVLFILAICSIRGRHLTRQISDLNLADSSALYASSEAEYDVHSVEEAVSAASGIQEACRSLEIPDSEGTALAMCVEELAVNTFKHGKEPGSDVLIEIRLKKNRDGYVLTQTDNACLFDPVRYLDRHREDSEHIGIRTVRKLSEDMNYMNLFGLNRVTLKL